jgi:uncharacterized membrane protein
MLWVLIVVQWLHVLGGIFWFGSAMMTDFVLVPMLKSVPAEARTSWLQVFATRYGRIVGPVGGATILLGILRGVFGGVFGQITSAYGLTWIAAIVVGVVVAAIGGALIGPTAEKMAAAKSEQEIAPLFSRIARYGQVEVGGFLVLFTTMIAMRFGF